MTARRVYPRVCGGTIVSDDMAEDVLGLSPRVRGNQERMHYSNDDDGSIPACAGEPQPSAFVRQPARVYPRVCGGTGIRRNGRLERAGLSPRVRGNHRQAVGAVLGAWSIPACAGEPAFGGMEGWNGQVYPRVCGGTRPSIERPRLGQGLSPRVRGNRGDGMSVSLSVRSIPACAGEPLSAAGQ